MIRTAEKLASALLLVLCYTSVDATELKDPYLRDDDVSLTSVTANVGHNAQGLFVYTYDLVMPIENTGSVAAFILDISCDSIIDDRGFDPRDFPSNSLRSFSRDGKHIPVAIDAPRGQSGIFGIAEGNTARWGMVGNPGTSKTGLQLISPYPPGAREYRLEPSMRYKEEEWDYGRLEEDQEGVPWIEDMTVTGVIDGPACPGEEYSGDGPGNGARFAGSPFSSQHEQHNELLSYSTPLVDQLHLPAGTSELEMTIHYHPTIDPRTFRVTPQKHGLQRLFDPQPGTSETVRLPLDPGKNRIELQVQTQFVPPGQQKRPPRETKGRGGVSMDRDVFVIRVGMGQDQRSDKGRKKMQGGR